MTVFLFALGNSQSSFNDVLHSPQHRNFVSDFYHQSGVTNGFKQPVEHANPEQIYRHWIKRQAHCSFVKHWKCLTKIELDRNVARIYQHTRFLLLLRL